MDIYKLINTKKESLSSGESSTRSQKIKLYMSGVSAKLKNANYALSEIINISNDSDFINSSEKNTFTVNEKVHFYIDSFFAFLYSSFDVIAQVINQKYKFGIDEKIVSFKRLKEKISSEINNNDLEKIYKKTLKSHYFINLDKYRNCSTHRRQIYIEVKTTDIEGPNGYILASSASATGHITSVKRILCDDPLKIHPTIKQNRELVSYCKKMKHNMENKICKIIKKL